MVAASAEATTVSQQKVVITSTVFYAVKGDLLEMSDRYIISASMLKKNKFLVFFKKQFLTLERSQ